jgi:hypothetical protein
MGPAAGLTATQKGALYENCRKGGNTVRECCAVVGGEYEAIFDEAGNLIAETCTFHSDASGTQQPGVNSAVPPVNRSVIGEETSAAASGGHSNAGEYGWTEIIEYPIIP